MANKTFSVFGKTPVDFDAIASNERELFGVNVRLALRRIDAEDSYLYLPFRSDLSFMKPMEFKITAKTPLNTKQSVVFEKMVYEKLTKICENVRENQVKTIIPLNDILPKTKDELNSLVLILTP